MVGSFSVRGAEPKAVWQAAEEALREESSAQRREAPTSDAIQPSLQARFFGRFEIHCNGEPVDLGRNGKALAVFKYLLAHRDRRVSRDHLMESLWPESSPKKARSSLNVAICTLRKLLGDCLAGLQNCILLEEGYYRLCPPIVRVATDVEEFDLRYERGCRVEKTDRIEGAAEYERAVELYRGDYLLEHLYDDWTMVERERLSNAYMDMLERLAVYYKESEQLQESIRICYRILQKDLAHENCHLLLTEAYVLLGSYGRALRQYRLFRGVLKSGCAAEPSGEVEKRFGKILGRI